MMDRSGSQSDAAAVFSGLSQRVLHPNCPPETDTLQTNAGLSFKVSR